ncbi:MAG TPA: glycerol-3-phosphate 1-O-acyltransferase PlsY, partial [Ferruginibacter sp.]|nr:glycerol-3-phosphate 1-O-acyltransferase PlsY [Ferruginibacter sp.]
MKELLLIVLAYLIGSIPTALIVSKKFFGIDIRDYGSGNMGATNTFRVLGSKYGTLVMVIDILKGLVAASLYGFIPFYLHNELERTNFMIGLGLAAMLGHIFPLFAGFKGGKGVATLFGMILAVQPVIAVSCTGVFLLVLYLTRYVSLSSILAAVALPICVLWIWNEHEILYRAFALVVAGMVVFTHQKNIGRILRGVE